MYMNNPTVKFRHNKFILSLTSFVINSVDSVVIEQLLYGNTEQCFTSTTTSEIRTIILKSRVLFLFQHFYSNIASMHVLFVMISY